jgi:hypothetical protein
MNYFFYLNFSPIHSIMSSANSWFFLILTILSHIAYIPPLYQFLFPGRYLILPSTELSNHTWEAKSFKIPNLASILWFCNFLVYWLKFFEFLLGFTFHLPVGTLTTTDNHAKNHSLTFVVVGLAGVKFLDFYWHLY